MRSDPPPVPRSGAQRGAADTAPSSSHLDLLDRAAAVQQAALGADHSSLHAELRQLRVVLVEHVRSEESDHARLPHTTRGVVAQGQRDLVRLLDDLLATTEPADEGCACVIRAATLHRALTRQALLENGVLRAGPRDRDPQG